MDRRTALQVLTIGMAGLGLAACASGGAPRRAGPGVLSVARSNGLTTFVRAAETADLAEELSGEGPFTLFAPSEAAFRALPAGRMNSLLRPANRDDLRELVSYHVVPGMLTSGFLLGRDINFTTAAGTPLTVDGTSGRLRVNGAGVTRSDIDAGNGVIHVLDRVLTPR
jgi:uncharacterized surface protein with fasciclin (FAS1) repeats